MTKNLRRAAAIVAVSLSVATVNAQRSRLSGPLDNSRRITLAGRVPARGCITVTMRTRTTTRIPTVTRMVTMGTNETDLKISKFGADLAPPRLPSRHRGKRGKRRASAESWRCRSAGEL